MMGSLVPALNLAIPVAGLALVAYLHFTRRQADTHGASRWARGRDLRLLLRGRASGQGIILGWFGRRLVEAPAEDNVIAFGVQRSGKTSTLVVPSLLEWNGVAVATSTKDELVRLSGRHRMRLGPVYVFAPLDASVDWVRGLGLTPVSWNAVDEAISLGVAAEMADTFTAHGKDSPSAHWYLSAANLITALLVHQRSAHGDLSALLSQLNTTPREQFIVLGEQTPGPAGEILVSFGTTPEREAGSIASTARSSLSLWLDERVAAATAASSVSALDIPALLRQPSTLYLVAPAEEAERCRPLFSVLLGTLLRRATARARELGGVLNPRLLLALDEVANFARIPRLASYVSTGPGQGIQTLLCFHDLAQLEAIYGQEQARTVWNNSRARILLPGQGDLKTLQLFSQSFGNETVLYDSPSWSSRGGRATSEGRVARPLSSPDALRRMTTPVLVYANAPPARLTARRWDQVPEWRSRVAPTAHSPDRRPAA